MTIKINQFDQLIVAREGKKLNLSIAQCKEVRKIVLTLLAEHIDDCGAEGVRDVLDLIGRHAQ